MAVIDLSQRELDALSRTAMSEVGHFGRYGEAVLEGGVAAVVDTIINRVAHPAFPATVDAVVDAPFQFSAIGGPGGSGTWGKLKAASPAVQGIVERHLSRRVGAAPCSVKGATHFLNPHLSSANALAQWGNYVVTNHVAVWGVKQDVHYHGYAPDVQPAPSYVLGFQGKSCSFSGRGVAQGAMQVVATEIEGSEGAVPDEVQNGAWTYKVERLGYDGLGLLETALNRLAGEGWRLRQIMPEQGGLLLIMEAFHPLPKEMIGDPGAGAPALPAGSPEAVNDFDMSAFTAYVDSLGLSYFKAEEFLVLGNQNASGKCEGRNTYPPRDLWANIGPTARVLDALRKALGAPIQTLSVYRSPAYNACISGSASNSLHMKFMAVDFSSSDGKSPVHWARQLKAMRDAGVFKGGIGVYQSFVHVDTRGTNANFGPLMGEVF
jgi:hypothetical protein